MTNPFRRPRAGLLALSLSAALAAPAFAAKADIPYSEFTLPNGLRVIVHEDHKAPIVAVNLWYHVGSKDERPGRTGFAHLYEHLMFEASENHKGGFFEPFEQVGATDQNGTTNSDRTNFFENVPTTALDMALWMESDRMGHLLGGMSQESLDQQRGVVENEKRQGENQPYGRVDDALHAAMYPVAHPYHHTTIGSKHDLDAASLDDVKTWFRTWYGPNNTVLVLAGDIDLKTAREKVTRYFGDIPASPTIPTPQPWPAVRTESGRDTMLDRVAQPRLYKIWNVPGFGNADEVRLQMLSYVLGGGKSSRLSRRLVHEDKLADGVSAGVDDSELGGQFQVVVDIKRGVDPGKIEAIVDEELARLLKDGPTPDEVARVRAVYEAGFIRGIERIGGFGGKADILAECAVYTGDAGCFRERQATIDAATPGALRAAGTQWLAKGDYTLLVKPVPEGTAPPPMRDDSTANDPYATKDRPVPPIDPKFRNTPTTVDRHAGVPSVTTFPDVDFPKLQHATLSNGMKVVLAERHEIPVVQMSMVFPGGFASDRGGKPGTASFTMGMLDEGAGRYDSLGLGDRKEVLGAQISSGADLDTSTIYLSALKVNLDDSLALYSDVVRRPTFNPKEIERVRKSWIAGIAQEKNQPAGLAQRLLPPLVFGNGHPYAAPTSGDGDEASIASLTRDDLVAFQQRMLRPDNATLVVVGDTTLGDLVPRLEKQFGDWKAPAGPLPVVAVPKAPLQPRPRVFLVDQPGAIQATIFAAQPVRSAVDPTFWNFTLANDVLGGQFTARLNMNLREGKHWAYGSSSYTQLAVGQQTWFAQAQVQIDKTAESLVEMRREIGDYVNGKAPATAAELAKVKADAIRRMPGQYETGQAAVGVVSGIVTFHWGDDYVQTKKARIEAISLEAVHDAAKDIHPDALTWLVVGDLSKIEAPVRALKLGEVTVLDADGHPVAAGKPARPAK